MQEPTVPTTDEQSLRTAAQRQINLIWENTQGRVAIIIVVANILFSFTAYWLVPNSHAEALMANALFLVLGFYFGRTNHARIGDTTPLDDRSR